MYFNNKEVFLNLHEKIIKIYNLFIMKKYTTILIIILLNIGFINEGATQDYKPQDESTVAVLNIYSNIKGITPSTAGSLLRIELEKTGQFKVFDKHDLIEIGKTKGIDLTECYGKLCLYEVGNNIEVDKMFSGSIEQLGKKIVISLKMLDISTNTYEKTSIQEFINMPSEIQVMMQITLNKMLDIKNNVDVMNTLVYFNEPPETPNVKIRNNGPRVGVAFVGGVLGDRLMAPKSEGGWGARPVVSQFGYQWEKVYLSAGNFQALIEGIALISGPEQQLFNPKLVVMNGFRSNVTGLEFAFGPSFGLKKVKDSYFDTELNKWKMASEWNEVDVEGNAIENPFAIEERLDSRGVTKLSAGWVIGVGKTFKSGYLNMPVNLFASFDNYGYQLGLSVGFNIKRKEK